MVYDNNKENVYKPRSSLKEEVKNDLEKYLETFRDPVVIGEMVYKLIEERENTNRILKNLLQKIENLEKKIEQLEGKKEKKEVKKELLLPAIDKKILEFLKEGPKTAEDVRKKFKYKGKNAASARLNKLFKLGLLKKENVGKKVYFMLS